MKAVKLVDDHAGIWYAIPNELYKDYMNDLFNAYLVDRGTFEEKYLKYRTNGGPNGIQLYVQQEDLYAFEMWDNGGTQMSAIYEGAAAREFIVRHYESGTFAQLHVYRDKDAMQRFIDNVMAIS